MMSVQNKPIIIFGELDDSLNQKVVDLRKKVQMLGYDNGEAYIHTLPHLTLTINKSYQGDIDELRLKVKALEGLKEFSLPITDVIIIDENIAVEFNNSYSKALANKLTDALSDFGFEVVETYFMKLVRSSVKTEYQQDVKEMLKEIIPSELRIAKISAATGEIRREEVFWTIEL